MSSRGAYAPDEIQNSMFLPLMKKALMGVNGAETKTSVSLAIIRLKKKKTKKKKI